MAQSRSEPNLVSFQRVLQDSISVFDTEWKYDISGLPSPAKLNAHRYTKAIVLETKDGKHQISIRLQTVNPNRGISGEPLDKMLRAGIFIQGVRYNFYGHSKSQLKSRTCVLFAGTKEEISRKVNGLGNFSKMKMVQKKAKRIGLLFSEARAAMIVPPDRCEDIADIKTDDYNFTDGCGLISHHLAQELTRRIRIVHRNARYHPSVFQIRYRGYKGVLMEDRTMKERTWIKFRKSMKKFSGGDDLSFSVVEYSKPYSFGNLNDEVILLIMVW